MKTMDNQQESLLWWLGGIIDGEGCITINHHRLHKGMPRETLLFKPVIAITNTNKLLIETCQKILTDNQIPFWVSYREKQKKGNLPVWCIRIEGIKRCIRAINILSMYIIAKKNQSLLLKEFCERRLHENKGNNKEREYKDRDFEIITKMVELHNSNPQRLYAEIRSYRKRNKI